MTEGTAETRNDNRGNTYEASPGSLPKRPWRRTTACDVTGALPAGCAQVHRLVSKKMDVYWDLLSLQDPKASKEGDKSTIDTASSSTQKGRSIREFVTAAQKSNPAMLTAVRNRRAFVTAAQTDGSSAW